MEFKVLVHGTQFALGPGPVEVKCPECKEIITVPKNQPPTFLSDGIFGITFYCENCGCVFIGTGEQKEV